MRVEILRTESVDGVRYKLGTCPVVSDNNGQRLIAMGIAKDVTSQYPAEDVLIEPQSTIHRQTARH